MIDIFKFIWIFSISNARHPRARGFKLQKQVHFCETLGKLFPCARISPSGINFLLVLLLDL